MSSKNQVRIILFLVGMLGLGMAILTVRDVHLAEQRAFRTAEFVTIGRHILAHVKETQHFPSENQELLDSGWLSSKEREFLIRNRVLYCAPKLGLEQRQILLRMPTGVNAEAIFYSDGGM